jgi:hypothetical protein
MDGRGIDGYVERIIPFMADLKINERKKRYNVCC